MKHSFEPDTDGKPAVSSPPYDVAEFKKKIAESMRHPMPPKPLLSNELLVLLRSWQERAMINRDSAQDNRDDKELYLKSMARAATYDVCADELKIWIARAIDKAL